MNDRPRRRGRPPVFLADLFGSSYWLRQTDELGAQAPARHAVGERQPPLRGLLVELGDELADAALDVVSDLADALGRLVLGVGELPGDVALAGDHGAGVVTGRDDDVGPSDRFVVEPVRDVVGGVDAYLAQGFEHLRVGGCAGVRSGGAGSMAAVAVATKE